MGKVFMTVAGKGLYQECAYELNGRQETDRFIQKALIRLLVQENEQVLRGQRSRQGEEKLFDKVICFMTEESEAGNWEEYVRYDRSSPCNEIARDEGLAPFFRKMFPEAEIIPKRIPFATTAEELLETFGIMYDSLGENDVVTLDVTHGFRFMPMLFLPLLIYARELKEVKVDAIYYGAFEASGDVKPVIDLTMYYNILVWASAAHGFVKYGSSSEMSILADEMYLKAQTARFPNREEYKRLAHAARSLNDFTSAIQTSRGSDKEVNPSPGKYSILHAYQRAEHLYSEMGQSPIFPPLNNLLDYAMDSVKDFTNQDVIGTGVETVRWCIRMGMVQQGYTALEETIITYCCLGVGYTRSRDYLYSRIREQVGRGITALRAVGQRTANIDNIRRMALAQERAAGEAFERAVKTIPFDLIYLTNRVKEKRNDINHFGMGTSPTSSDQLKGELSRLFRRFCELRNTYPVPFQ